MRNKNRICADIVIIFSVYSLDIYAINKVYCCSDYYSIFKHDKRESYTDMYSKLIKRTLDIVISFLGIVVFIIPMAIIALAIKLDSKGPILFWQKRIGKDKKTYMMPKFRSMYTETPSDVPTHLLSDPQKWITPVGKFLRRSSLDELPQLFSILAGKMSIVGPRPALWNQFDLIEEREKYGANGVRPGLTGWAQINGRDELPITVKARFDGEYIEKMSFSFDCKCFFGTFVKVISHDGFVEGAQTGDTESKVEKEPETIEK